MNILFKIGGVLDYHCSQWTRWHDFKFCTRLIAFPIALIHLGKVWIQIFSLIDIGQEGRVFINGLGDLGSIPGCVIPKTLKMVLDASLLNIQQCKVRIKGKVEQSKEWNSALPYTSVSLLLKKERSRSPSTTGANFAYL